MLCVYSCLPHCRQLNIAAADPAPIMHVQEWHCSQNVAKCCEVAVPVPNSTPSAKLSPILLHGWRGAAQHIAPCCCRYLFSQNGIKGCNYDMSQAGVYTIVFSVTNSQGLSASVNRTLAVQPICPPGQTLCSDQVGLLCSSAELLICCYNTLMNQFCCTHCGTHDCEHACA